MSTTPTYPPQATSGDPGQTARPAPIFQTLDATAGYPYTLREYVQRTAWNLVRQTLFRWSPSRAFRWRRFLLRSFGAVMGDNTYVRRDAFIWFPWLFEMGRWSTLADGVTIYNLGPVRIGQHTVLSQGVYVCAGSHDYTQPDLPLLRPTIEIGSGVWVAAQAFIGPGTRVGDNCVIGARAVVVRDIPDGMVAAGNPAKPLRPRPMNTPDHRLADAAASPKP